MRRRTALLASVLLAVTAAAPAAAKEHVNEFNPETAKTFEISEMSLSVPAGWSDSNNGAYQFFIYANDGTNATITVMEYGDNAKELNKQGKDAVIKSIEDGMKEGNLRGYSYVSPVTAFEKDNYTAYSFEYDAMLQDVLYDNASYLFVPKEGETAFMLQYQYDTASAKDLDLDFARILDSVSFKAEEVKEAQQSMESLMEGDWLVAYTLDANYKKTVAPGMEKVTFDRDGGFYINDVAVGTWDLLNTGGSAADSAYAMITSTDGDAVGTAMYGNLFPEISDEPQIMIQFYGYEQSNEAGYLLQRYPDLEAEAAQPTTAPAKPTVSANRSKALDTAKGYLKYGIYSAQGLYEQLLYEGYGEEDAKYGVENCGADWFEEAAAYAESVASNNFFVTKSILKMQLEYAGFTDEEVEYGLAAVGY